MRWLSDQFRPKASQPQAGAGHNKTINRHATLEKHARRRRSQLVAGQDEDVLRRRVLVARQVLEVVAHRVWACVVCVCVCVCASCMCLAFAPLHLRARAAAGQDGPGCRPAHQPVPPTASDRSPAVPWYHASSVTWPGRCVALRHSTKPSWLDVNRLPGGGGVGGG